MSSDWKHAGVPASAVVVSPAVAMPWLVELLVSRAGAAGHTLDGTTLIESAAALSVAARADAMTANEPAGTASRKFLGREGSRQSGLAEPLEADGQCDKSGIGYLGEKRPKWSGGGPS